MSRDTLRHSLWGGLALGGLVGVVGAVGALREEAPFPEVLEPLLVFVILGATVGALTGPLIVPLLRRLSGRRREIPPP